MAGGCGELALCPGWLSWRPGSLDPPQQGLTLAGEQLPGLVSVPSVGSLTPLKLPPRRLSRFVAGIWPLDRFYHTCRLAAVPSGPLPF